MQTYGMITLNNGDKFRARRDEETGKVTFMGHHGLKTASKKISKSFQEGAEAGVPSANRYRFPDEYLNPNMSQTTSKNATWKQH